MTSPPISPLVVERDSDFLGLIRRGLGKAGVAADRILTAFDGDEAIRLLSRGDETPSFVTLDLRLPGRSGLEVLEWIRGTRRLATLHVFIMTLDASPESVSRAFELGVSSYFVKPPHVDDLDGILAGIVAYTRRREYPVRGSRQG